MEKELEQIETSSDFKLLTEFEKECSFSEDDSIPPVFTRFVKVKARSASDAYLKLEKSLFKKLANKKGIIKIWEILGIYTDFSIEGSSNLPYPSCGEIY